MNFSRFTFSIFLFILCYYHGTGCKNKSTTLPEGQQEKLTNTTQISPAGLSDTTQMVSPDESNKDENAENLTSSGDENEEEKAKPKGFVVKNNTVMYEEDNIRSKQVATLSKGESVFLMETSLADENGQMAGYPTWYKVQLANKKKGWIESSRVSFGH